MTSKQEQTGTSDCPEQLTRDDLADLRSLPPSGRAAKLLELGRCVAHGTSDEPIVDALVELALEGPSMEIRDAWLSYVAASQAEGFFPLLERWAQDSEEERRAQVVGVLAWNRSSATNDALLRLVERDESKRVRRLALKYLVRRGSLGKWEPIDLFDLVPESDWRPVTRREYLKLLGHAES